MLFPDVPFLERFQLAERAGFRYVEYQFPYEHDATEVAWAAGNAGVEVVLHNLWAGDIERGDRGIACLPDRVTEFRDRLPLAVRYATASGCRKLNCLAGLCAGQQGFQASFETLVANVAYAARVLEGEGMQLMVEAVNTRSVPGFLVDSSALAMRVLSEAGAPNARLQFDVFHMQIMEGDLSRTIERLLPHIGHVQIADVPGRGEPGSGELGIDFLLSRLDDLGYEGFVGCEYNPAGTTVEGLAWARTYLEA